MSLSGRPVRSVPSPQVQQGAGVPVPLTLGPYQNNGATPWYTLASWGSPGQTLKTALDTGSNFNWITSSLCAPSSCQHAGEGEFVFQDSSTFRWTSTQAHDVSFGPWGTMTVEDGQDNFSLPAVGALPTNFYLADAYSGDQFAQLDWDGGIGLPSGSAFVDPNASFLIEAMMNTGRMDPRMPYVSFSTDQASGQGSVLFGGVDADAFDPESGLFLPWTPYQKLAGVEYIWTTPLVRYQVGDYVATSAQFCLDSGSSQFKGDPSIMNQTLARVGSQGPNVILELGETYGGLRGVISVPPSVYMVAIQAGPEQGQVLPQFNAGLPLPELVLVGSVLMDQLYTVYTYDVTLVSGAYRLAPVGMYVFNKKDGAPLIQKTAGGSFRLGPRPIR